MAHSFDSQDWGRTADAVILFDEQVACAYCTATGPDIDVFGPELVSWWYNSSPVWVLRAIIALPQPNQLMAPSHGYALPKAARMPLRVRIRER